MSENNVPDEYKKQIDASNKELYEYFQRIINWANDKSNYHIEYKKKHDK